MEIEVKSTVAQSTSKRKPETTSLKNTKKKKSKMQMNFALIMQQNHKDEKNFRTILELSARYCGTPMEINSRAEDDKEW